MKQRPLSPHLSIYKLQITSGTSILHRITGAFLFLGIIIFSWMIFCLVYFPGITDNITYFFQENAMLLLLFKAAMFGWCFALYYHLLNGIRHLFWDMGKGLNIHVATITGKLTLLTSVLLTIISWVLA